jgi:hypothetical protein
MHIAGSVLQVAPRANSRSHARAILFGSPSPPFGPFPLPPPCTFLSLPLPLSVSLPMSLSVSVCLCLSLFLCLCQCLYSDVRSSAGDIPSGSIGGCAWWHSEGGGDGATGAPSFSSPLSILKACSPRRAPSASRDPACRSPSYLRQKLLFT